MRLYTAQPLFVYEQLLDGRPYIAQPLLDGSHWLQEAGNVAVRLAYDWLVQAMAQRGLSRPQSDAYPTWAWHQWAGPARPRPDLRSSSMRATAKDRRHALLTLEVPDNEVLLHDFDGWHFCLNYWYLDKTQASDRFEKRCIAQGESCYRQKPLSTPELHAELVRSWDTIFDLKRCRELLDIRRRDQQVQATVWKLEPLHVRNAVAFGAGQPLQKLPLPDSR